MEEGGKVTGCRPVRGNTDPIVTKTDHGPSTTGKDLRADIYGRDGDRPRQKARVKVTGDLGRGTEKPTQ